MESDGDLTFADDDDNTSFPEDSVTSTAATYDDNLWHFVSAVKTTNTRLDLYVDGVHVGADVSLLATGSLVNDDIFYLGIDGDGAANDYQGFLDQVKVYRSARSAANIKADLNQTTPNRGAAVVFSPQPSDYLSHGLVGYWKMDEASGDASDSSGNGVTLTNQSTVSYVGGKFGNSIDLVPASTDYFSTATDINGIQSISFWVYPDDVTANYFISYSDTVYISVSSGTLAANGFTGTFYVNGKASTTLAVSTWQLVTVTFASINAAD